MQEKGHLLRVLGLVFGFAVVVGGVIGQGILRSPGIVAEATGSPTLIIAIWAGGMVMSLLFAFSWVELGAAIPNAGGPCSFIRRAFGGQMGVLAAFASVISYVGAQAYLVYVLGEFLERLGVGGGDLSPAAMGIAALFLFAAINASGTRLSGFSQILLSSIKGLILIGLVVLLFSAPGHETSSSEPLLREGLQPLGAAVVVVITTYTGWYGLVFFSEEIENPGKAIPRAVFGGILGVAAIYLLINLAFLHVMTPDQMAGSNLVAADAAGMVFGAKADFVLTCFGVLSVGAVANVNLMTTIRLVYAVSRAGILPRGLAVVSENGTPNRAMIATIVLACIFILSGGYLEMVTLGETIFIPVMLAVSASVLVLRRKEPDLARPYRVPWFPWTIYLGILVQFALLAVYIAQDPIYAMAGFVIVGILWILYHASRRLRGEARSISEELESL